MTLLTVEELREHVATSLVDDALQRLLDDAEAEIDRYAGPLGVPVTELIDGGYGRVITSRRVSSVTSIVETAGSSTTTLSGDDWRLRSAYVVERLSTGTNPRWRWSDLVTIVYLPVDDEATRKVVQLELVKLEIAFTPGLAAETVGAWTQQYVTSGSAPLDEQRAAVLSRLADPSMAVV